LTPMLPDLESRRIGEYLRCNPVEIESAASAQIARIGSRKFKLIGEILVERELISWQNLVTALAEQRCDRLRQCLFFAEWTDDELSRLSRHIEEVSLRAGESLLRRGDRGDSMYLVAAGCIMLYRQSGHSGEFPVGVACPGDVIGENGIGSDGTRNCSAFAVDPALLLRIPYGSLWSTGRFRSEPGAGFDAMPSVQAAAESPLDFVPQPLEFSTGITQNIGSGAMMGRIAKRTSRIMRAERCDLFLLESESADLVCRVTNGRQQRDVRVRAGTGIAGWVVETGQLATIGEAYLDPRFDLEIDLWCGHWTRTLLAGPVRDDDGSIIGVIQVANKKGEGFTREDEVLYGALLLQSAKAIEYCRQWLNRQN
jgi:hypothetical protein